jgi:hypothetical protein
MGMEASRKIVTLGSELNSHADELETTFLMFRITTMKTLTTGAGSFYSTFQAIVQSKRLQ